MVEFENKIVLDRPVPEVFEFLSDFENIPLWNYYVLNVRKTSPGEAGVETTYHQVRKEDEQDFRITEFEPNDRLTVKTLPDSSPRFERRFTLTAEGESTRLLDEWQLDTGRPAILEKLAKGQVRSAVADNLGKLKELLETGRVTLQDGRQTSL